jgi:diphthamide synthase (EF-2-diphthine--ammonia ligase)
MVDTGLRSVLTCVNPKHLDRSFAGRQFDRTLLNDLPAGVDKCGERGEFHSFAWDGPMFKHPVSITVGEVVDRDGYVFADVS